MFFFRGDTRHPYNKPEITNCARCGCESSAHEVDEGTDARERGNDSFAEGDYRAALIAYSKYVILLLFRISNCSPTDCSPVLGVYQSRPVTRGAGVTAPRCVSR